MFNSGATGLIDAIAKVKTDIATEQVKISEQTKLETVFVNARMEIVEDPDLLNILQRPYYGKECDYNLAKDRLSIIDEFIDLGKWSNFCQLARKTSEKLLRDRPSFSEVCDRCAKVATLKRVRPLIDLIIESCYD